MRLRLGPNADVPMYAYPSSFPSVIPRYLVCVVSVLQSARVGVGSK
jgi:hypothetical protein